LSPLSTHEPSHGMNGVKVPESASHIFK